MAMKMLCRPFANLFEWALEKWDWFIYWRARNTLRRMCKSQEGFAYMFELELREWREEYPIGSSLKSATEYFHEAMKAHGEENNPPRED
jgi:hypothetical protein